MRGGRRENVAWDNVLMRVGIGGENVYVNRLEPDTSSLRRTDRIKENDSE